MPEIKKIVLTGGPCAGKTTALVKIVEYFSGMGYDQFYRLAEVCEKPVLIVCDRGAMDISAYIKPEEWQEITQMVDTDSDKLRQRYDAVLHLVSAADGAEQYYTTATNATRYEKADEEGLRLARELDKKVINAWSGHSHLRVINNHDDFNAKLNRVIKEISNVLGLKLNRVIKEISNVLGLPQPLEKERLYKVEVIGEIPGAIESEIIQTYLVAEPGCEIRLRRRKWSGGKVVNVHRSKKRISETEELETERKVDNNLYEQMLQQADPYRATIKKKRQSFIWKGQHFEIDTFQEPVNDLVILQSKGVAEQESVKFPPFVKVLEDVTGNSRYYNYNIALRK